MLIRSLEALTHGDEGVLDLVDPLVDEGLEVIRDAGLSADVLRVRDGIVAERARPAQRGEHVVERRPVLVEAQGLLILLFARLAAATLASATTLKRWLWQPLLHSRS